MPSIKAKDKKYRFVKHIVKITFTIFLILFIPFLTLKLYIDLHKNIISTDEANKIKVIGTKSR
jgi:hypothetical protein